MDVVVGLAAPEDLAAIQQLNRDLFESDAEFEPFLNVDWPHQEDGGEKYFRNRIAGVGGVCFVAKLGAEVVGYAAGMEAKTETYSSVSWCELENICVASDFRNRGVGAALVQALCDWSRGQGATQLFVEAYSGNRDAIRFYQEASFRPYAEKLVINLKD